jgi:transcriptional regulator with PAS, ATPase and Fis domain
MTTEPGVEAAAKEAGIIGASPAILQAVDLAMRFAGGPMSILLIGATGTGKELFAQAIHRWSRRPGRLVDINCGGLPRELVEAELFGNARGAYTGAVLDRPGLLAAADRGTVFLDELTSLALESQAKLLRVLETGLVRRLGECTDRPVEFRLVGAAQPELVARVQSGQFRRDLYYRVTGVVIELPPLVERPEDIGHLAHHFARRFERVLHAEALGLLEGQPWPGNVRELRDVIQRAVWLSGGIGLDAGTIREAIPLGSAGRAIEAGGGGTKAIPLHTRAANWLEAFCEGCGWDADVAAVRLGVSRATLFRLLRANGLSLRRNKATGGRKRPAMDRMPVPAEVPAGAT